MGWFDIFAAKHRISGDYFVMQGESGSDGEVYLFVKGQSVSIAGPLHRIGWNQDYIVFTDANWPVPWNVIRVRDHVKLNITDAERVRDSRYRGIEILAPSTAWTSKAR